jgi:DNA-directed RNA polymerase subunit RPC12/RpoP
MTGVTRGDDMKCPYCGETMELGYIPIPFALEWIPFGKEPRLIYKKDGSDGFRMDHSFFNAKKINTYFCRKCKKLVIDLEEQ